MKKNLPLAEGDLEWADSVTGSREAELLQKNIVRTGLIMWYTIPIIAVIMCDGCEKRRKHAAAEREREQELKQKVLLVVPHQDDELFVGGGLLKALVQGGGYEAYVVFTTNGDYFAHEAQVRLGESLHVLTRLYGIEEDHIFFLGYGDGWKEGGHLYHQEGDSPLVSEAGRTETYGMEGHGDYRWERSGRHSAYRRADIKRDLKDVLREVRADLLLSVDFDKHADHRAASLLTEECLGELFREMPAYRPVVLKRFAYDGVWKGRPDFFDIPRKGTVLVELSGSPYTEEEMIRTAMPEDCATPCLFHNFLYQALRCYKTQEIWQKADEIINIDEVYFRRSTGSFLYGARLEASSGNPEFLRDFKLFDCGDVAKRELVLKECGWKPEESDKEKRVRIRFGQPVTVGQIAVYARGESEKDRLTVGFSFDTGAALSGAEIHPDGKRNLLTFEAREGVREMELRIERWEGVFWGITELEILPPEDEKLPQAVEKQIFHGDAVSLSKGVRFLMRIQKAVLAFRRKLSRWLPNSHALRRLYPELAQKRIVPAGYRIKYIMRRIRQR